MGAEVAQRQLELQRQIARTRRLGSIGEMIDPAGDGTLGDKAQEIRRRPRRFAVDTKQRVVAA